MKRFPVLMPFEREHVAMLKRLNFPKSVPWDFLAPHEKQARSNHDQSLRTLASRGGLDPREMLAVISDRRWDDFRRVSMEDAAKQVISLLEEYERA